MNERTNERTNKQDTPSKGSKRLLWGGEGKGIKLEYLQAATYSLSILLSLLCPDSIFHK